jgi:hypothetical protein
MTARKIIAVLFLGVVVCLFGGGDVLAQADESSEPTTVSSITDATLPWGAQRVLPGKVPAEFNATFDKIVAEGGGKFAGGAREVLAWEGNYKNKSKADGFKTELQTKFRKEGWQFESLGSEGGVELFSLTKDGSSPRAAIGYFVAADEVFVCALMEIQKADSQQSQTDNRPATGNKGDAGGGIVGKWFRTTGGSTIDWTGKTTLKGGEDFTFEFFPDGSVEYTRKKEILNIMQCRINSLDNARGRYTLTDSTLRIDLGAMRSTGSNSCDAKGNYNKTIGESTMKVQVQIKRLDDIARPDRPYMMCFDGNEVCYEKQR